MKVAMGIIKVEISLPEAVKALEEFRREPKRTFELILREVSSAVSNLFDQLDRNRKFKSIVIKRHEQIMTALSID